MSKLLLGEPFGTANGRLKKMLIFELARRLRLLDCYRCGDLIRTLETFSVEHKESWRLASNPRAVFFNLKNITFSHLSCNCGARNREKKACNNGHLLSGSNLYLKNKNPRDRCCRACQRDARKARRLAGLENNTSAYRKERGWR